MNRIQKNFCSKLEPAMRAPIPDKTCGDKLIIPHVLEIYKVCALLNEENALPLPPPPKSILVLLGRP